MFEKIRDLIVEEVGVDEEQVTMDASFKNDLNIDSLDLFEMVMTLEEEFDVEIPSEDLENIDTVGDLIQVHREPPGLIRDDTLLRINGADENQDD